MSFGFTSTNLPDNIKRLLSPDDRKSLGKAGMTAEEALRKAEIRIERDLQNVIENWLNLKDIVPLRARMDKKTTNKLGTPDFLFAVNGRACAWEVKLPNGELDKEQIKMAARLTANGWNWTIITSLDECIAELRTMGVE